MKLFENFIGQEKIQERFYYLLEYYKTTKEKFPHILLIGPHGYGKTTFARLLGNQLCLIKDGVFFEVLIGSDIKKIINFFRGETKNIFFFIDEIHKLKNVEYLFQFMEKSNVTIIGATTKEGNLDKPFLSRFKIIEYFKPYSNDEMIEILRQNSEGENFSYEILQKIIDIAPNIRVLLNFFKQMIILKKSLPNLSEKELYEKTLYLLDLDERGLDYKQRMYIELLRAHKELSLKRIALLLQTSEETVETLIEPLLFKRGYITITEKGRRLNELANNL
ncbi:MAG: AAA family ATPase [Candidatus Aenigmatarchaeota archaeon]